MTLRRLSHVAGLPFLQIMGRQDSMCKPTVRRLALDYLHDTFDFVSRFRLQFYDFQ